MKYILKASILLLFFSSSHSLFANKGTNYLNQGNTAYLKGKLKDAMKLYSQAGKFCIDENDKIDNNKALVFAQRGKYNLAKEHLNDAIDYNPNNGNAYYNRGIVNLIQEDYSSAVSDLDQAKFLTIDTDENLDYNLAIAHYLGGDIEKAKLSISNQAAGKQDARLTYLKGLIAYSLKDYNEAVVAFADAAGIDNKPHIRYAHGLANYYNGNQQLGLSILEDLKDKEEFQTNYNAMMANLAFEANDLNAAKQLYNKAIKKNKKDANSWSGLGSIAMSENLLEEAATNYNNAIKYDAKNIEALSGLARIEFLNGQPKSSIVIYDKVLALSPADQKALYGKALAAMSIPDPYTCLDELAKIDKTNLSDDQIEKVVILEASALGICNKKNQAVNLLKKYRRFAKDKYKIKTLLGYYYLRMFQYANAVGSISISKYKTVFPYLIAGHASLHRGQYSSAYSYYRKAYKLEPQNPDVLMGAALSMIEINMIPEAKRVIDSLEVLYPDNYYVFNSKGIIYKDIGINYKKKNQIAKANTYFDDAAKAFERANEIRPSLKTSFDNNLALTYFYWNDLKMAKKLFNGSPRLASINNRALVDISEGNYNKAIATLDSLNNDFIRKNKVANSRVKNNLILARKKAPMNNNYKFITYYFLHQDKPEISEVNPFKSEHKVIDLPIDLQPHNNLILEYSDIECEEVERIRKKKKKSKPKFRILKKKDKNKCPTFKT